MNPPKKNPIYLMQVYNSQCNRKSEILTTFEKIHHSFIKNLKSEETESEIKANLLSW